MRTKDNIFSQYLLKYSLKWNKNSHQKYTQVYVTKCVNCYVISLCLKPFMLLTYI